MDQTIKELSLLLLFLSSWEEEDRNEEGVKVFKTWKGYLFEVLKKLEEEKMIKQFFNKHILQVLPDGIKKAENLKLKYLEKKVS